MLHVIGCITEQHDPALVAVAFVMCGLASLTTMQMLGRAQVTHGAARFIWVGAGGFALGCGVWVTHFVAMLAYRPGLEMAFDIRLTLLSLLIAIVGGVAALGAFRTLTRPAAVAAGLLLGGAIGAMHFAGMAAFEVPGVLTYGAGDVAAAWAAALVFAPLGMLRFVAGRRAQAAFCLVLAIAGLHFIAMSAITLAPNGARIHGVATAPLAIYVAGIGIIVLFTSLAGAVVDQHLERRLAREAVRFRQFADATFEGLFFLDGDVVTDANGVLCRLLGRALPEIVGAALEDFFVPESRGKLEDLRIGRCEQAELMLRDADGNAHSVDVLARPLETRRGAATVLAVRDASERKHAERRIHELAHSDPLTGLANRFRLRDRLTAARAQPRHRAKLALMCLNLDWFKTINDTVGYRGGDRLLIDVAARLGAAAGEGDTVARLGGDEFIVLCPNLERPEEAMALAEGMLRALVPPFMVEGRSLAITATIGIALTQTELADSEILYRQANLALQQAKREARGSCVLFEPGMDTRMRSRRELEQDLRQALTNRELHLHYQPVFDSETLAVVGYEALLRWRHPKRGNVSPAEFIPLAEQCGLISAIGRWVLETACAEAASWTLPLTIAVNLSPAQFQNQDLARQVRQIVTSTGLATHRLELEVTEGLLVEDTERAQTVLGQLKSLGIRLALDDFGTGYSSLSYLRRFPFDRLKIDRAFVAELGLDADADAIVGCIMAMARSLRLEVTAEGVETEQQLALLRGMRCGNVQGYLLGRPAAACELAHARLHAAVAA
ncbi:MAG TPA: EAL domain-containing protein [Acetobacteraceae bacterium]|nr:EAL domain-containing protein [Acetobacteraceae bacterium]